MLDHIENIHTCLEFPMLGMCDFGYITEFQRFFSKTAAKIKLYYIEDKKWGKQIDGFQGLCCESHQSFRG